MTIRDVEERAKAEIFDVETNSASGWMIKYQRQLDHSNQLRAKLADTKAFVDRFLCWHLPKSVHSDLCVIDHNYPLPRYGTSLLTADEAAEMVNYLLEEIRAALEEKK